MPRRAWLWLRSVVLRRRLEREMQEEMAGHLERAAARLIARGLAPDAARREARREFGSVPLLQEYARGARGGRWVDDVVADARYAMRHFARAPLTRCTMFVVLALGIGIATLLFSAVHSLAVQPPSGVARADDLVRIRASSGREGERYRAVGEDEFRAYRTLGDPFRSVAGWTHGRLPIVLPGDAERVPRDASVTFVTENYFAVLGVRTALGPGLPRIGDDDAASANVAVIAHATWEHVFGRDPGVIGATVTLRGVPVTIVGVAPERFHGVSTMYGRIQLWLPLAAQRHLMSDPAARFGAAARLRPGASVASASAVVRSVARRAADGDSARALEPSAAVVPLLSLNGDPEFEREVRRVAFLVGLLALLVLLVTCTNVSALLMGLATARRQEVAVRLSLGASRARLVRQLLTESVLLAAMAAVAALGLVALALRTATRTIPALPFELAITGPAAAFTFGVALAVGVLFGLSPALHGTRVPLGGALRDSVGGVAGARGRLQRALVVAQITFTQPLIALLAMVLVLVVGELRPHRQTELGDRLVSVLIRPRVRSFDASPTAVAAREELRAAVARVTERLRATPGVETTVVDWRGESPLGTYAAHPDDRVRGAPEEPVRLTGERAASGYFAALGIPVVRGREFAPAEVADVSPRSAPSGVVIGADLARRVWGGADAVGRRLVVTSDTASGARALVVVGVIDDPMAGARSAGQAFRVYLPPDTTQPAVALLVRTAGAAAPLIPAVRAALADGAAGMVAEVQTLAELQDQTQRNRRLAAGGISAAGVLALLLSAIGLYAVIAFSVGQRTREIAVRMAVGAPDGRIVRGFVADGVRLGAIGLVVGLPLGLLGLDALHAADGDFPALPVGPVTAIAALGVLATATLAAWLPARRAAAIDPAVTLRAE